MPKAFDLTKPEYIALITISIDRNGGYNVRVPYWVQGRFETSVFGPMLSSELHNTIKSLMSDDRNVLFQKAARQRFEEIDREAVGKNDQAENS